MGGGIWNCCYSLKIGCHNHFVDDCKLLPIEYGLIIVTGSSIPQQTYPYYSYIVFCVRRAVASTKLLSIVFRDSFSHLPVYQPGELSFFLLVLQQQLASYQTEKNRLSLTLEERTEQERAEQSKTLERLEQELVIREKAEAAAAEAERERSVLAVDLKDMQQRLERLKQEYNALQDKVRNEGRR